MRVCQFRHFGVARLPNGAARLLRPNSTDVNGSLQRVGNRWSVVGNRYLQRIVKFTVVERVSDPDLAVTITV